MVVGFMMVRDRGVLVLVVLVVPLAERLLEYYRVGWERWLLAYCIILMTFGCHKFFSFLPASRNANRIQIFVNGKFSI